MKRRKWKEKQLHTREANLVFSDSCSTLESIRTRLLDQINIDITLEHADPQVANHRSTLPKSKPDFYSTKFAIIEFLFKHLLTHSEPLNCSSAYDLLPSALADQLKSEQGGLKSIILSYRHALRFDPISKSITLANPLDNAITSKQKPSSKCTLKTKPCFFDAFHPDGCPLPNDQCAFSHETKIKVEWSNIIHVRQVNNQSNLSTYEKSTPSQMKFLVILLKVFAFSARVSFTYKYATKRMSPSFIFLLLRMKGEHNHHHNEEKMNGNSTNADKRVVSFFIWVREIAIAKTSIIDLFVS